MNISIPHGGSLVNRILHGEEREAALQRARELKQLPISGVALSDFEMISCGAMSPLKGFMTREDYQPVLRDMRLKNGLVWSLPIVLPVSDEFARGLRTGEEIALVQLIPGDKPGSEHILGLMRVEDIFTYDKNQEAEQVYRTRDVAHPGVARLQQQSGVYLGGEIRCLNRPAGLDFAEFRREPAATRQAFQD
ncbi:MAG: sulfate adenylyltransferase, partial [Calditrichaeota bacterium]